MILCPAEKKVIFLSEQLQRCCSDSLAGQSWCKESRTSLGFCISFGRHSPLRCTCENERFLKSNFTFTYWVIREILNKNSEKYISLGRYFFFITCGRIKADICVLIPLSEDSVLVHIIIIRFCTWLGCSNSCLNLVTFRFISYLQ